VNAIHALSITIDPVIVKTMVSEWWIVFSDVLLVLMKRRENKIENYIYSNTKIWREGKERTFVTFVVEIIEEKNFNEITDRLRISLYSTVSILTVL